MTIAEQDSVTINDDLTIPSVLDRRVELSANPGGGVTNDRIDAAGAVKKRSSWRDHLPVHPAAELFR